MTTTTTTTTTTTNTMFSIATKFATLDYNFILYFNRPFLHDHNTSAVDIVVVAPSMLIGYRNFLIINSVRKTNFMFKNGAYNSRA